MSQALTGIAADPTMPKIGQRVVGRYDIVRLLGQGGFAAVFEAVDSRASGHVAIKVLHAEKSFDESFANRFRQEVMLVRQLQHPNTIKITDAGTTETGCLFMVMEYVQGGELVDLMSREGAMQPERVVRIGEQVLKALSEAHSKGIVHRDLKPQNIMIGKLGGEEDYVKVLDFGIAKALEPDMQQVQTQAGMVFCTPKYAAPEILMARGVTPAADVYALGLIMVEMLTGRAVIDAPSEAETIARALSPEPVPLPPEVTQLPLGAVLAKAVAKTLSERYQNADEMLADLRKATQPQTTPGGFQSSSYVPVSGPTAAKTMRYEVAEEEIQPRSGGRTGLWIFLSLVALAVVGAVGIVALKVLNKDGGNGEGNNANQPVAAAGCQADSDCEGELVCRDGDCVQPPEDIVEPDPVWGGPVAVAYVGEAQEVEGSSATLSMMRLLDEAGQLNQLAMNMLSQALLSNQIPGESREEVQNEYLAVVGNLVITMVELDLCEGAARRLDRAFGAAALVPPNAAGQIGAMRRQIQDCRSRVSDSRPEWNRREYSDALDEAFSKLEQAEQIPAEQAGIRESRFLESLEALRGVIGMLEDGFENDGFRNSRERDGASGDLYHAYASAVRAMLELELRISAEAQLEEILDNAGHLPDDALTQSQELQLILRQENEAALSEHGLTQALDPDAPWSYVTYRQIVQLAQRSFSITRGAAPPSDGGQEPGGGEEGEEAPANEAGEETESG